MIRILKGVDEVKRFYLGLYYGSIVTIIGIFFVIMAYMALGQPNIYVTVLLFALLYILMIIIGSYLPLISAKSGRLRTVSEGKLLTLVDKVVKTSNIDINNKLNLYYRPALKRPVANATVQGYSNFTIILNEDLVRDLKEEEIEAVLYHEIFHIKEKHDLIRTVVTISVGIVPMLLFIILDLMSINIKSSAFMSIISIIMFVCISLFILYIYRKQEFDADLYATRKCNSSQTLINALSKMTSINKQSVKMPLFREILSTHPSLNNRIDALKRKKY